MATPKTDQHAALAVDSGPGINPMVQFSAGVSVLGGMGVVMIINDIQYARLIVYKTLEGIHDVFEFPFRFRPCDGKPIGVTTDILRHADRYQREGYRVSIEFEW